MFNLLYFRVKFAFCGAVLGAIFALTGAAFAAENIAAAADKNAAESGDAKIGKGFRYSDYLQYDEFNSSTKTDFLSHPFLLNPEPFDLPAEEFGAAEGGGLVEFISSPLGGFVIAAGIFAGATAIDKNNRDDDTPPAVAGDGTTPPDPTPQPQQCTAAGEISDGSGGCRCDSANNYVANGAGTCVMQEVCTGGMVPDGIGGCMPAPVQCTGDMVPDGSGGCECTGGMIPDTDTNDPNDCRTPTALQMCQADSSLESRVFAAGGTVNIPVFGIGSVDASQSFADIVAGFGHPSPQTFFARLNPGGVYGGSSGVSANGILLFSDGTSTTEAADVGDIIVLYPRNTFLSSEIADDVANGDAEVFRVYRKTPGGELFLAQNERADQQARACAPGPGQFFLTDNTFVETSVYAADNFRLRDGLRGLLNEKYAVRLKNFFFTANDSQLRDFHLEHRFHLFGDSENVANEIGGDESANPSGFSAFAESGYKRQNGGRTALHYNKLTAIRDFTSGFAIYAQGISGRINSEIYRDSRLQGFAAGVFADKILSHDDSYHLRIESPLSAPQIARTRMAIDARIGEPENYWRIGFYRGLEEKKSAAKLFWLREF